MVVGTLSLVQKGQNSGCSILWMQSNQWMQWTHYAVRSGIVVYGSGDIVFGAKKNPVDAVCSECSRIVVYGGGDIVFGARVKPVDALYISTTIYHYSLRTVSTAYCVHCVLCPLCDCIH